MAPTKEHRLHRVCKYKSQGPDIDQLVADYLFSVSPGDRCLICTRTAYRSSGELILQGVIGIGFGTGGSGSIDRASYNDMEADKNDDDSHSELGEHDVGSLL